ncbi:MAG TPA: DUF1838 family protein [Candidatus Syntrophosphaera sp.]|nr:DUF1838 family protein [Candidatus Syntrophosphaera sp.]
MSPKAILLVAVLFSALALAAASGEWSSYTDQKFAYSLQYPSDWQVAQNVETGYFEVRNQPDKAAPANTFAVQVADLAEADRNMDFYDYMAKSLADMKKSLESRGYRNIRVLSSIADTLNGAVVHRIQITSNLYGNLTEQTQIVRIRHGDKHFTLTCSGEQGYYYDLAKPDFERMIASFKFKTTLPAYLNDYIRVRADLDGSDTVFHWTGSVFGWVPGEKRRELFSVEGFYIVRAQAMDNGYYLLGREAAFFLDHRTGQLLQTWRNPYTGNDVPVLQVFNDPVNQDLTFPEDNFQLLPMILPSENLGDMVSYHSELFPFYPNPLQRKDFPLSSQNNNYQAAEFTQYLASRADLANSDLTSVPATFTFTRIYPWLPFMLMGERSGNVVMVCRGRKLENGFDDLPQYIKDQVKQNKPEFSSAPENYTQPNETIWSYFKKQAENAAGTTVDVPEP